MYIVSNKISILGKDVHERVCVRTINGPILCNSLAISLDTNIRQAISDSATIWSGHFRWFSVHYIDKAKKCSVNEAVCHWERGCSPNQMIQMEWNVIWICFCDFMAAVEVQMRERAIAIKFNARKWLQNLEVAKMSTFLQKCMWFSNWSWNFFVGILLKFVVCFCERDGMFILQ